MKVLILGNGIAGISVAKELRSRAENLEISVLARESYDYYSRIRLPEVFGGGPLAAELLALYKPSWYAERRIEVSHAIEVVSIERGAHRVMLSTGEELGYDVLVLQVEDVRHRVAGVVPVPDIEQQAHVVPVDGGD